MSAGTDFWDQSRSFKPFFRACFCSSTPGDGIVPAILVFLAGTRWPSGHHPLGASGTDGAEVCIPSALPATITRASASCWWCEKTGKRKVGTDDGFIGGLWLA